MILGREAWHNHLILVTSAHVYEFSGATFGIGYFPAPVDIKGNISGTIIGFRRTVGGDLLALTQQAIWRYTGASTWVASPTPGAWAKSSGLWSHDWFNEDGTGLHGFAWWGSRGLYHPGVFPCNPEGAHTTDTNPKIRWAYLVFNDYLQLIGDNVTEYNKDNTSFRDCSTQGMGIWHTSITGGTPDALTIADDDSTLPNVWQQDSSDFGFIGTAHHFSPYGAEAVHDFTTELFIGGQEYSYDNVFQGAGYAPVHFTDDTGKVWAWSGAYGATLRRNDGAGFNVVLSASLPGQSFALNAPPSTDIVRAINGGTMYKSIDDGANWTTHPGFSDAAGIYTAVGEIDRLYGVESGGSLWLSNDEGENWCKVFNGPGQECLGIWVDTSS